MPTQTTRERELSLMESAENDLRMAIGRELTAILAGVPEVAMATDETRIAAILAQQIIRAMGGMGVAVKLSA